MRICWLIASLGVLVMPVLAQEPKKGDVPAVEMGGVPGPGPEHEVLHQFAGTWDVNVKMWMQPGAQVQTGAVTDRTEMVCNGMWALARIDGTFGEGPFSGRSMTGYDPAEKKYIGVWIDSMGSWASTSEATWDAASKTFTSTGDMTMPDGGHATMRTVAVFKDADTRTETVYMPGPDGKEFVHMEINAKRTKAAAKEATLSADNAKLSPEHKYLAAHAGNWDADFSMTQAGAPPMSSKCTEVATVECAGQWVMSLFKGDMMGMPFEGRGMLGYDTNQKKYVSYWFDGFSPTYSHSTGTFDAATKTLTMRGKSTGMMGEPIQTEETTVWTGDNAHTMTMVSKNEDGSEVGKMTIRYTRAK